MMKIALTLAMAAALMPAPLVVGSTPAEAQNLRMAQVDVQLGGIAMTATATGVIQMSPSALVQVA
jgi:hypothetical protein